MTAPHGTGGTGMPLHNRAAGPQRPRAACMPTPPEPHATRTLGAKLRELLPYFARTRWAFVAAFAGAAISAATETSLAALIRPLIDKGFVPGGFPLWAVPAIIISLFLVRGVAGFVVNYALAWAANDATLRMRAAMFGQASIRWA